MKRPSAPCRNCATLCDIRCAIFVFSPVLTLPPDALKKHISQHNLVTEEQSRVASTRTTEYHAVYVFYSIAYGQ